MCLKYAYGGTLFHFHISQAFIHAIIYHSNSKLNPSGNDIACEPCLLQITPGNQGIRGVIIKLGLATMAIELRE